MVPEVDGPVNPIWAVLGWNKEGWTLAVECTPKRWIDRTLQGIRADDGRDSGGQRIARARVERPYRLRCSLLGLLAVNSRCIA